jgi:undecaprenyl diphosphate synthase
VKLNWLRVFFSRRGYLDRKHLKNQLDLDSLPEHVAIIMDGNGRWAKKRGLPRIMGHRAGVESLRAIIETSANLGIRYLTLYAFSTENWKRPPQEVKGLMDLLVEYLQKELAELHKNNVKIRVIGEIEALPEYAQKEVINAGETTRNNTGLMVNIALNYGSRAEIIRGIKDIARRVKEQQIEIDDIDEEMFSSTLYTANIPDPDLVIRTSGEYRVSNFLLYQIAYAEFWFTDILWPDFDEDEYIRALVDYQHRNRRFGGISTTLGRDE